MTGATAALTLWPLRRPLIVASRLSYGMPASAASAFLVSQCFAQNMTISMPYSVYGSR